MTTLDPNVSMEDHITSASIDISTVRRSKNPHVYVVNTSDFDGNELKGEVSLKFQSETGIERYKFPDTWIPMDITQWQEKEKWTKDVGFNNLVSQGYLTIIDPDVAEEILESGQAKEEIRRVRQVQGKLRSKESEIRQQINKATAKDREKFRAVNDVRKASIAASTDNNKITPRVMTIMMNKDTDELQKLAALKNAKNTITEGDINYIMVNCGKDNPRIKAWAIEFRNKG